MPRAIIFDFDGVIADTEWLHSEAFRRVLAEEGIFLTAAEHNERFLGVNDREGFTRAFAGAGRTAAPAEVQALVERKSEYYRRRLDEVRPFPGAVELIAALSRRCLLAIASGGRRDEIECVLRTHGLRESFLAVLSADEVARSKPAPDAFLEALEALRRVAPDRTGGLGSPHCVVIEDSLQGIRAARAAGMRCIAVAHTYPRGALGEADLVFERIADIPPERLLATPAPPWTPPP